MASNPLLSFKKEILTNVIYPKLYALLTADKGDISISDLWKSFRESFDCSVSLREFKEWCEELGLHQQQVIKWNIPEGFNETRYTNISNSPATEQMHMTQDVFNKAELSAFNRMMDNEPVDPNINFDNE